MKSSKFIAEAYIPGGLESLNSNQLENILFQMKNCICKIKNDNGKIGTGFFCKIPFPDPIKPLPVLITCNHVLDKNNISPKQEINFSFNNGQKPYSITINARKTFTDEKKDVTIIEIEPQKDEINDNSFLDIDEEIAHRDPNEIYTNKSIYIIHYEEGNEARCSLGKILKIKKEEYDIEHNCSTKGGSSGSPIINLKNFKIIGVHTGFDNINLGSLLKKPIIEFNKKYKNFNIFKNKEDEDNIKNNIISVIVKDEEQKLYSLICQITDIFSSLETELFKKSPSLKNQKHYYLFNDKKIDVSKTLEQNNIFDNSIIYYKIEKNNDENKEKISMIKSSSEDFKS